MHIVLGADRPIPCKIRPSIIISKLVALTHNELASKKTPKPIYTDGFLPIASDKGQHSKGPKPNPKKIMVINSWLSACNTTPRSKPITSKAGNNASMANAVTDISAAIKAINSN